MLRMFCLLQLRYGFMVTVMFLKIGLWPAAGLKILCVTIGLKSLHTTGLIRSLCSAFITLFTKHVDYANLQLYVE